MKKAKKVKTDAGYRSAGFFNNLDIKGFKREAVIRGMDFDEVLNADIPTMYTYIVEHFNDEKDTSLLDKFDDYVDKLLRVHGSDELVHPSLRLGFIGERDEETGLVTKMKRIAGMSKNKLRKKRASKTSDGVVGGTAKAMTFELYRQGKSKPECIKLVAEKFPKASDKSVGIWWNKAKRKEKERKEVNNG